MSVKYCPFASWDKSVVNDPEISKQWCIDSCALWSNGGCGLLPSVSGDSEIERLRRVEKAAKTLRQRMELVHNDYRYYAVWSQWHNQNGPWQGPTYEAEGKALDAALAEWEAVNE